MTTPMPGIRNTNQQSFTPIPNETRVYCTLLIGDSGAPTLENWIPRQTFAGTSNVGQYGTANTNGAEGILSVAGPATTGVSGQYVITFDRTYNRLLHMSAHFENATGIAAAPLVAVVGASAANPNVAQSAITSITVQCSNTSATATNPASRDVLKLLFCLQGSNAKG